MNIVIQSGGKLIGKGAYGCIFSPPLVCRGSSKPRLGWKSNKLGKMTEVSDIKNEIAAAKVLGKFPDAKKYCILPEIDTLCKPANIDTQDEKGLKDCEPLEKYGSESMMQYELEFGGKTLKTRIQMSNFSESFPFFKFMGDLLEVGSFLLIHGCIHNDLHSNNIVMNADFKPRLIDFGRSYMHNTINNTVVDELSGVYYNPELNQIPPEITAHHGVNEGVPLNRILTDIRTKKGGIIAAEQVLGLSRSQQMAELKDFWNTSRAVQTNDWVAFYKLYWPSVDSWAIGANLLGILKRLLLSKKFAESEEWLKRQANIKSILRDLLQSSPRKRIDSLHALARYDPMNAFVTSASGKAWLEK